MKTTPMLGLLATMVAGVVFFSCSNAKSSTDEAASESMDTLQSVENVVAETDKPVKIGELYYALTDSTHTAYVVAHPDAEVYDYGCSNYYEGDIVIPDSVTHNGTTYNVIGIGDRAFKCCDRLKSVKMPDCITDVQEFAFCHCDSLIAPVYNSRIFAYFPNPDGRSYSYTIPNGIEKIAPGAFASEDTQDSFGDKDQIDPEEFTENISITIPNSVTSIEAYAFYSNYELKTINIGKGVKSIGHGAFSWCVSLRSVTIPQNVTSIKGGAFSECWSLKTMKMSRKTKLEGDIIASESEQGMENEENIKVIYTD